MIRSQLRSRVASSRFRSPVIQQSSQQQPAQLQSAKPVESQLAPSLSRSLAIRPSKSRILRPNKLASPSLAGNELSPSGEVAPASLNSAVQASSSPGVRSSKPRFVVVTRTGQFGIRASAISSQAAAAAASQASQAAADVASTSAAPPASLATNNVRRVVTKPSRFANRQSIQPTRLASLPEVVPTSAPGHNHPDFKCRNDDKT